MAGQYKLATKLRFLGMFAIIALAAVLVGTYSKIVTRVYEEKCKSLEAVIDVAYTLVVEYDARVKAGEFSLEEGQRRAALRLKTLRYQGEEYFWVNDLYPKMIMHPFKPELDGKDLTGYADPTGKHLFVEFAKVCKEKGHGFVEYMWPKPGNDQKVPVPKISFLKLYQPWGWVIGTGIYLDSLNTEMGQVRFAFIGVLAFVAFIGGGLAFWFARSTSRPITLAVQGLRKVAVRVSDASSHVASASHDLADGASQQAASIEQTSASVEEIASMTKRNADNSTQADRLMKETSSILVRATQSMSDLTLSMNQISSASQDTQKIVKTIDEIAFQTNLLALNAAVEAARAGEAGAGFAVVADEVRNLALRAAEAARNTAALIEGTVGKVKIGAELVSKTTVEFSGVTDMVGKAGQLVGEIAMASSEQSDGLQQLNSAVSAVDDVVQKNAASAEQTSAAAQEMTNQATRMQQYITELASVIGGGEGNEDRPAKPAGAAKARPPEAGARRLPVAASGRISRGAPVGKAAKIAPKAPPQAQKSGSKEIRPEEVIPFDEDFNDF